MSSQTFTPASSFSSNERDWQAEIGMLPWDTEIVFTKESLVRFLKQVEVEVDTNMTQLKKLPKYAKFGKLSSTNSNGEEPSSNPSQSNNFSNNNNTGSLSAQKPNNQNTDPSAPVFIPTRKVREQPGGGSSQIASLLAGDPEKDNWIPPPIVRSQNSNINNDESKNNEPSKNTQSFNSYDQNRGRGENKEGEGEEVRPNQVMMPDGSIFIPTRKVREPTGGFSSMASILSGK